MGAAEPSSEVPVPGGDAGELQQPGLTGLRLDVNEYFHIFRIFLAEFLKHLCVRNHHNNMLVFYVPTITVLIYTNLVYYLTN